MPLSGAGEARTSPLCTFAARRLPILVVSILLLASPALAQRSAPERAPTPEGEPAPVKTKSGYTGTAGARVDENTVDAQLEADDEVKDALFDVEWDDWFLAPYFDAKAKIKERTGLSLGLDYTALYEIATEDAEDALAAVFRVFGSLDLIGKDAGNVGSVIFRVENRHGFGTVIPAAVLSGALGFSTRTAVGFSDDGWLLSNLYWRHRVFDSRLVYAAGQLDISDYVSPSGMINRLRNFTNSAFGTNPTIPTPSQGLGAAAFVRPVGNFYLMGGFSDSNADATEPFRDVFHDGEFFSFGQIGWFRDRIDGAGNNLVSLTGWHADERTDAGVEAGWGLAFSGTWQIGRWSPFLRAGYADGASPLEAIVSTGFGFQARGSDQLGFGLSWARAADREGSDQYTSELFYRLQVLPVLEFTPDVQLIYQSNRDNTDVVGVFGFRIRLAL
jgi:porin